MMTDILTTRIPTPTRPGLFTALLSLILSSSQADDWNQFGGPNADFAVDIPATELSAPPSVLWSRELGFGNSGIVADKQQAYTQFRAVDSQGNASDEETVIAVGTDTGKTLWSYSYLQAPLDGQENYGGGNGPHATPCIHGNQLFTLGFSGSLHAFDRITGALIWKKNLVEAFGATPVQFGFSSSPVVFDGILLVSAAGSQGGLLALDPATGRQIWHSAAAEPSYATPVKTKLGGQEDLIYATRDRIEGIDPASGKIRWSFDFPKEGLTNVPTPMPVGGGRVFAAGQGAQGALLIRFEGDTTTLNPVQQWRSRRVNFFHQTFIRIEDLIVGGESFLYGVSLDKGRVQWKERGFSNSNLIRVNDSVLALGQNGTLRCITIDDEGPTTRWSRQYFDGEAWTPATLTHGKLLLRNRTAMVALDLNQQPADKEAALSPVDFRERNKALVLAEDWEGVRALWSGSSNPYGIATAGSIARHLAEGGRSKAAIQFATALSAQQAQYVRLLELAAWFALRNGDVSLAKDSLQTLLDRDPKNPTAERILSQLSDQPQQGNARFVLKGFSDAKCVTLAGGFNQWDPNQNLMRKTSTGWETQLDLPPGEYPYKFIVDGNWMLDPDNKLQQSDGNNNVNSLMKVE